jgi:hypothetical protein
MYDANNKNNNVDQITYFVIEKTETAEILGNETLPHEVGVVKIHPESSTLKPLRKRRRQLTGW